MTTSLTPDRPAQVDDRPTSSDPATFDDVYATIAAGAVERERSRTLAHSEVALLWERRFGALRLPVDRGGAGASVRDLFSELIALAAADSNITQAQRSGDHGSEAGEFTQAFVNCTEAVELAALAGDPLVEAICENHRGNILRSLARRQEAADCHRRAVALVAKVDLFSTDTWMHSDVPFLAEDTTPGLGYKIRFRGHLGVVRRSLALPDLASADAAATELVALSGSHLNSHAWALVIRARVERARRDAGAFLATESELKTLADSEDDPNGAIHRYWLNCVADNATHLNDYGRTEWASRRRIVARALQVLKIDCDERRLSAVILAGLVQRAREAASQKSLTTFGNAIYDVVKAQYFGGALDHDRNARAEALRMLDCAEDAWSGFAVNGVQSLRLMRAQISLLEFHPPIEDLTLALVSVSEMASNENTARRGLVAAVRSGVVGSGVVWERLRVLLAGVDREQAVGEFAVLSGLVAEWWFRVNAAGGTAEQLADWEAGEQAALEAARLLRPAGVSLDPSSEATCWHSAAMSVAAQGGPATEQLERLLWSVRCVAELMVTVSTSTDRARQATRFAPVFATAAQLAVDVGDHEAADVIMEAARRDRVGLILAELARNPDVDTAIRSAALAVTDSTATTPDTPLTDNSGEEEEPGPATQSMDERSAAILVDREQSLSNAERVLGPLGTLCDAGSLMSITAITVLRQRADTTTATAVVQLLPQDTAGGMTRIVRRVSWIDADSADIHEHLDMINVPEHLLMLAAGDPNTFSWAQQYAKVVLPQPVMDLLDQADRDHPLRLLMVPTGLFHVPFDALPIPNRKAGPSNPGGEMLIDRAVISVHGSLTSMLALMKITTTTTSIVPSAAVYDTTDLKHADTEYQSLTRHLAGVTRVEGADELRTHLNNADTTTPITMLAMGVHGTADDDGGWGQGKQMPDGSIVTAAQVLGWTVPRLCVLASCHSGITTADGIELGGFPLALMLRGAVTVIGGLYAINDETTTGIMTHFWAAYAAGTPALNALHHAKHQWLQDNPHLRTDPKLWAGLIAYGAATD